MIIGTSIRQGQLSEKLYCKIPKRSFIVACWQHYKRVYRSVWWSSRWSVCLFYPSGWRNRLKKSIRVEMRGLKHGVTTRVRNWVEMWTLLWSFKCIQKPSGNIPWHPPREFRIAVNLIILIFFYEDGVPYKKIVGTKLAYFDKFTSDTVGAYSFVTPRILSGL